MPDGQRIYPVDHLVMHHSVGPEFTNATDQQVSDWFNQTGRNRGYVGVARSGHLDPDTGRETFAQAHWALRRYTLDGNKYGWRLTLLIADPENNVAWHAGNWQINQRSFGIETCGNFVDKPLDEKALMLVADSFRDHDRELVQKGHRDGLQVYGHRVFYNTACPGMIFGQIDTIIDMINNPDPWNRKLWPAAPQPKPQPTPPPVPNRGPEEERYNIRALEEYAEAQGFPEGPRQYAINRWLGGSTFKEVINGDIDWMHNKIDELEARVQTPTNPQDASDLELGRKVRELLNTKK